MDLLYYEGFYSERGEWSKMECRTRYPRKISCCANLAVGTALTGVGVAVRLAAAVAARICVVMPP